jgi:PPM family protein phosphatase
MLSHPGLIRKGNEDACAASPKAGAYVVCDGMGGAAAGEVASHLAAETFISYLTNKDPQAPNQKPQTRVKAAVEAANHAVFQKARVTPNLSGMGTTLVALLHTPVAGAPPPSRSDASVTVHPVPPTLWLAHVGDSRCYRRRGKELTQLTADHSLVEEQIRAGHITAAEAVFSPMRNVITRAVGSQSSVEVEIEGHRPRIGDLYLLASDGLTRELTPEDISMILADIPNPATRPYLAAACETLIKASNHNGGHDNITVLLIAFL